jgi:hypothetical protein
VFDDPDPIGRCESAVLSGKVTVAVGLLIEPDGNKAVAFGRP